MKKIVVAVVAMLAIGTSSFAQGFGWGVKAGLNVSGMNNTGLDSKTGLTAGVFVDYRFNDWIGMSADLLFSREGAMLKSGGDKYIAKTNYLNLPILAKFYVLDHWHSTSVSSRACCCPAKIRLKRAAKRRLSRRPITISRSISHSPWA